MFELNSFKNLQTFLSNNEFDSFWKEFENDFFIFKKKRLQQENKRKKQKIEIRVIQKRIIDNKRRELFKYFERFYKKFDWNFVDYVTLLFHNVRKINIEKFKKLFYNSIKNDAAIDNLIWQIIQHKIKKFATLRVARKANQFEQFKSFFQRLSKSNNDFKFDIQFQRNFFQSSIHYFKFDT